MNQTAIISENPWKIYVKYLIPSILSLLAVSLYSFTDTFVVGQAMGSVAVAAMGLGTPVVSCLYALGFLLGTGGAVRYAVLKSQNLLKEAQKNYTMAFISVLVLGVVFCIFGNIYIRPFAEFLGASENNIGCTIEYIRWLISLSGFLMMDIVLNAFMRNEGHPVISAIATATGTGLNIILDFVFVMIFKWGMSGAASATCIASIISVAINGTYAVIKKTNLKLHFHMFNPKNYFKLLQLGFGTGILEGAVAVITIVFLNAAGKFTGEDGVAAFSVIITMNIFVYCLINGVAQAMQPLVSSNYGAGYNERCGKFLKYSVFISLFIAVFFLLLFELFPQIICSLFVKDSEKVLEYSVKALRYHSISFIFMAVSIQLGIFFQAKENSLYSFLILLGRSVFFPVLCVMLLQNFIGETAVWISIPSGEAFAMILSVILLFR